MKPKSLTPVVLAKLGFPKPLDFDVKPDGSLAVVDGNGQKYVLPKKDWEGLVNNESLPRLKRAPQG